jgi:hypothetical protein
VATSTGITASLPAMLALVEAIGGRTKTQAHARRISGTGTSAESGHGVSNHASTRVYPTPSRLRQIPFIVCANRVPSASSSCMK